MERPSLPAVLLGSGLLLVLVSPLVITNATVFPYIITKAAFIQIGAVLCLAALLLKPPEHLPAGWLHLGGLVYLLVAVMASVNGIDPSRSFLSTFERGQGVVMLLYWLVFSFSLSYVIRDDNAWRRVLVTAAWSGYLVASLGLLHQFNLLRIDNLFEDGRRLSYTTGNASLMGAYLACLLPVSGVLLASTVRQHGFSPASILHATGLLVLVLALFTTGTRSAIAAGGLFALASLVLLPRRHAFIVLALVIVIALVAGWLNHNLLTARLLDTSTDSIAIGGRLDAWLIGLRAFIAAPVMGIGPENYLVAFGEFALPGESRAETFDLAHAHLLEIAIATGLIGLMAYIAMILVCLVTLFRQWQRGSVLQKENALIIAGIILIYQATAMVLFEAHVNQVLFYLSLGYCLWTAGGSVHFALPRSARAAGGLVALILLALSGALWSEARTVQPLTQADWANHVDVAGASWRIEDTLNLITPRIWRDWRQLDDQQKAATHEVLSALTARNLHLNWRTWLHLGYAWLRIAVDYPREAHRLPAIAERLQRLAPARWETCQFTAYYYIAQRQNLNARRVLTDCLRTDPGAAGLRHMLEGLDPVTER